MTVPEKYNLKYIFSNDKFYDPLLYFCGWQRLQQLENGIMVWEKLNVPPMPAILPKDDVPKWSKIMWGGVIPILTVLVAFFINIQMLWFRVLKSKKMPLPDYFKYRVDYKKFPNSVILISHVWALVVMICIGYGIYLFYIHNASQRSPENVITAYYNALDFKEFETAHSFLDKEKEVPIAQYMLEVSVTDGILSSYAKLDALDIQITEENENGAKVIVNTDWVTPLERVHKVYYHDLVKRNGSWFIMPSYLDTDIPPDQLFSSNDTKFYNHGRRRITTQQTYHEDVLKQPVLEVLTAKLVCYNGQYSVIGELQNVDNIPADVVIKLHFIMTIIKNWPITMPSTISSIN